MTLRTNRREGRRGNSLRRDLTFKMIILWTCAVALVLVTVAHAQIDGIDAATNLQHDHEPMPAPVDGGGELGPDNFCEAPGISGDHSMVDVWSAEMERAIGPHSVMPAIVTNSEPETAWSANVTVGTASDSQSLGWEEGAIMPVALMELPEPDPSPGPICNTVALE